MRRVLAGGLGLALPFMAPGHASAEIMNLPANDIANFRLEHAQGSRPAFGRMADAQMADAQATAPATSAAYGPADISPTDDPPPSRYRTFGSQVRAVKWEMVAILAYYTAINAPKLFEDPTSPHFSNEGWFGRSTNNVGMDKLAHAYSTYVISELIYWRLKHKTDKAPGIQFTAAALGFMTMLQTEAWDSIEPSGGWSWQDTVFNALGGGFSILRNSVPGLDRKLDYRLMVVPDEHGIQFKGKEHFQEQRYFFALKLSGFKAFEKSPLRFLELHAGYYGEDFTNPDRAAGIVPKRHIFVGFGINLRELLFRNSRGKVAHAAAEALDYVQPPFTAVQIPLTD